MRPILINNLSLQIESRPFQSSICPEAQMFYLFAYPKIIMILVACSSQDVASANAAKALISLSGLEDVGGNTYRGEGMRLQIIDSPLPIAEGLRLEDAALVIFMSRHSSASGTPAMTVHPMGNWGPQASLGGMPRTLSISAPSPMLSILRQLNESSNGIAVTYEATHHGPVLPVPALFAEFGGSEETIKSTEYASRLAGAVHSFCKSYLTGSESQRADKVVVGIGGTHYPGRFTDLALRKGYAFSHMMPKHAILNSDGTDNIEMLEQAIAKSSERAESAVIDWKSIKSVQRAAIIKKLEEIGIGYERI